MNTRKLDITKAVISRVERRVTDKFLLLGGVSEGVGADLEAMGPEVSDPAAGVDAA